MLCCLYSYFKHGLAASLPGFVARSATHHAPPLPLACSHAHARCCPLAPHVAPVALLTCGLWQKKLILALSGLLRSMLSSGLLPASLSACLIFVFISPFPAFSHSIFGVVALLPSSSPSPFHSSLVVSLCASCSYLQEAPPSAPPCSFSQPFSPCPLSDGYR